MRQPNPLKPVRFIYEEPLSPVWAQSFGPYPWFMVPFLGDVIYRNGWRISDVHSALAPRLTQIVPVSWAHGHAWGQWHNLSYPIFKAAVAGDLVRLDKALISAVLVDSIVNGARETSYIVPSLEEAEFELDMDYHVIIPSTFVVDGFERRSSDEAFVAELSFLSGQSAQTIRDVARGGAVFECVAHDISEAAKDLDVASAEVRLLRDRKDAVRHRQARPLPYQRLKRDHLVQFYKIPIPIEDEDDEL